MIRLTSTDLISLITAQNGARAVVSYSDATGSTYTGGTQPTSITSATTTTICSSPAASIVRDIDFINIKNTFAGSHTITVQLNVSATLYVLVTMALLTDESLCYTHGSGWCAIDANGNRKEVTSSIFSALTVTGNATVGGTVRVDDATDATSTITGSLQTDGGLGVVKALWVGGLANITGVVTLNGSASGGSPGLFVTGTATDATMDTFNGRNTSTGTSAGTRFTIGNNAAQAGFTLTQYGSNHSTKPNYVQIQNEFTAPLLISADGGSNSIILSEKTLTTVASATTGSGFNLPHGAAPTAPVNGDMWTTTTGLFVRINGATVGPLS